jgi:DNA-binding LacI/PurR family transcriptional regulator
MEDVAERASVSRALVSLVMNDSPQVSDEKRSAVLRAARELGYRPNLIARILAQQRTHTIGVLVDDFRNPFFGEVVDGIEAEAAEHDMRVLILNGHRDPGRQLEAVETFLQLRVEGMALVGARLGDDDMSRVGTVAPCVMVASGTVHSGIDTVGTDDRLGAELVVRHLAQLGHTRIVHLDGGANVSAEERRLGYESGMRRAGLGSLIDVRAAGDDEADALEVTDALLADADPPTAIFAFNDLLAAGALNRLADAGMAVPGDVSLVGFDNTFISALRHLSLTTVNQPKLAMGRLAVTTLLQRVSAGSGKAIRHTLQPELVVRGTTGPPPSAGTGHRGN